MHQLFFEAGDFVLQLLLAAAVEGFLAGGLLGHELAHLFRYLQGAVLDLGAQPLDAQQHGGAVGLGLADVGLEAGRVQAQQRVAYFHHLPFADEQFGNYAALEVLHLLQLGRGDGLAIATGDLVDLGEMGPDQHEQGEADERPDGQAHHARRILDQRLVDLGQGLVGQGLTALEILAKHAETLMRH
ncbi:hypothetical protein D9M69_517930 [compost metagenome]